MKELYAQREGEAAAIDETFDVEFIRQQVFFYCFHTCFFYCLLMCFH